MAEEDTTQEQTQSQPSEEEKPKATWEYRKEFRINTEMRSVVELTIKVTQAQIDLLRRKVEKLQYGS